MKVSRAAGARPTRGEARSLVSSTQRCARRARPRSAAAAPAGLTTALTTDASVFPLVTEGRDRVGQKRERSARENRCEKRVCARRVGVVQRIWGRESPPASSQPSKILQRWGEEKAGEEAWGWVEGTGQEQGVQKRPGFRSAGEGQSRGGCGEKLSKVHSGRGFKQPGAI